MKNRTKTIFLFKILPKSFLSRLFGYITQIPFPQFLLKPVISWYCKKFNVKIDEFTTPNRGFKNIDLFFTRELNKGVHTVDEHEKSIVSPVDARVDQFGTINKDTIIQAKGIDYSVKDLVPSERAQDYYDGSFMVLYLSPGDYHRIHSPVSGKIFGYYNIPGKLYTVQEFMVQGLKGLFAINERIISYIKTKNSGSVAVIKVGAMNVGRISLSYCNEITNKMFRRKKEILFQDNEAIEIKKGDELGIFHLGSTIVLLFQKDAMKFDSVKTGDIVRMGEKIGSFV